MACTADGRAGLAGAGRDASLVAAAEALMRLVDQAGARAG